MSLVGRTFGQLTVTHEDVKWNGRATLTAACECGKVISKSRSRITSGHIKSCGCLKTDPRDTTPPAPVDGAKWVPLGKKNFALVDDADYERVRSIVWHIREGAGGTYAGTNLSPGVMLMHRFILDTPRGTTVDHIDRNGLNNRRSNLRICSQGQNLCNSRKRSYCSSRFKGVYWNARSWSWVAEIRLDGLRTRLGSFKVEAEAAVAYDDAARKLHGEFARVNFPMPMEAGAL